MNLEVMTQEELKRYTIPVKYNGMTISGDMVDYPKTIHVTPICIGTGCSEVGLALTADESRKRYVDLSQVWHDVSESPNIHRRILVILSGGSTVLWNATPQTIYRYAWKYAIKWAYVDDLLPKGE